MQLHPIEVSTLALVAGWTAKTKNYHWLDFSNSTQTLTTVSLKFMMQRNIGCLTRHTYDLIAFYLLALGHLPIFLKAARSPARRLERVRPISLCSRLSLRGKVETPWL